jgi:ribose transport system substrate-binding protein
MPPASTLNYYHPMREGVMDVARGAGVSVIELAPRDGADVYAQAGMIQDAMSRKVDAIIITTHDEAAVAPLLKRAVDKGIIVVITNSDIPSFPTPVHAVIGHSQRRSMRELGRYVSARAPPSGWDIGYLEGLPGYHNQERLEGFLSGIDGSRVRLVAKLSGRWSIDGGYRATSDLLQSNPEINAIIAANDDMAIGASLAARSLGKHLFITGVDGQQAALEAIARGEIAATVDSKPYAMGRTAMQTVIDLMARRSRGGHIETPAVIRDASNAGIRHAAR